jgi:hypothetical protein
METLKGHKVSIKMSYKMYIKYWWGKKRTCHTTNQELDLDRWSNTKLKFWFFKSQRNNSSSKFSTYGLDQLVHDPTRVTSKSVTLIDHIYTSRPEEVVQVRVSTYCPGDHYPVSCSVKYGKSNNSGRPEM